MTHEFKVSDHVWMPSVVGDADLTKHGEIGVYARSLSGYYSVFVDPAKLVRAIPNPDPLTELERRVVEAAVKELSEARELECAITSPLTHAVDALLTARALKDPVAELRAAWTDWNAGGRVHRTAYQRLERAITALEAKEIK